VVDNINPVIVAPANIVLPCSSATNVSVTGTLLRLVVLLVLSITWPETGVATVTDACDSAPVITFSDVVRRGNCPFDRNITRTFVATDACGNTATAVQLIQVWGHYISCLVFFFWFACADREWFR
jgi:hypothetical protein